MLFYGSCAIGCDKGAHLLLISMVTTSDSYEGDDLDTILCALEEDKLENDPQLQAEMNAVVSDVC